MPGAGDLKYRLTFEKRGAPVGTDYGQADGPWQEQFTVWAGMNFLRGSEAVLQSRLEGRQPVVLTVRRTTNAESITVGWRALHYLGRPSRAVAYNITTVTPSNDGHFIDLLCIAGGSVG